MAKKELDVNGKKILLIGYIDYLFTRLRSDWSDNRGWCRSGWEAVSRLRGLMGIDHNLYRETGMGDNSYYLSIQEEQEEAGD